MFLVGPFINVTMSSELPFTEDYALVSRYTFSEELRKDDSIHFKDFRSSELDLE